jgi:hypothetical protein
LQNHQYIRTGGGARSLAEKKMGQESENSSAREATRKIEIRFVIYLCICNRAAALRRADRAINFHGPSAAPCAAVSIIIVIISPPRHTCGCRQNANRPSAKSSGCEFRFSRSPVSFASPHDFPTFGNLFS